MKVDELFDIKGKVVVIPGGNGRLGRVISKMLIDKGSIVVVLDNNGERENDAVDRLERLNLFKCNISNENDVKKVSKEILDKFGRVDVLLNCAVVSIPGRIFDLTSEEWDRSYLTNIKGAFLCVKYFGKIMKAQGRGNIIHFGSLYGVISADERIYSDSTFESSLAYATTKSALVNFTKYVATHLAKYGIRANLLSPGGFIDESNKDDFFRKKYCEKTPMNRMANEDDLKGVILFLVSDASRYLNGENIVLDGGWTAW